MWWPRRERSTEKEHNEMKSFYIHANGSIQVAQEAGRKKKDALHFTSEKEWTRIAGDLPMARLIAIWNAFPGVSPVERFTSRAKAAKRIWKAIEGLEPIAGEAVPEPDRAGSVQHERSTSEHPARTPRGSRRDSKKAQMEALLK